MPKVLVKRGTRSQLETAKSGAGLNAGEMYLITDEGRIACGTGTSAYVEAQPADGDLSAIAGLTGTGYAQRTGTNTWVLETPLSPFLLIGA